MQQQHTISRLDCDMRRKADCIKPAMASWVVGLRSSKALPKVKLAPKKRSWFTAGWSAAHLIRLSESLRNHYIWEACSTNQWDESKTSMPAARIGQQNGPNSSPRQIPIARGTINASKVEWIGLPSFASSTIFTWLVAKRKFFAGKMLPQPAGGRKTFKVFVESQSMDFYATGISKFISHWQKCVDCNHSYFD